MNYAQYILSSMKSEGGVFNQTLPSNIKTRAANKILYGINVEKFGLTREEIVMALFICEQEFQYGYWENVNEAVSEGVLFKENFMAATGLVEKSFSLITKWYKQFQSIPNDEKHWCVPQCFDNDTKYFWFLYTLYQNKLFYTPDLERVLTSGFVDDTVLAFFSGVISDTDLYTTILKETTGLKIIETIELSLACDLMMNIVCQKNTTRCENCPFLIRCDTAGALAKMN